MGKKLATSEPTAIGPCTCASTFQDATYGRGMRVHNRAPKKNTSGGYVCTVCKRIKSRKEVGLAEPVVEKVEEKK